MVTIFISHSQKDKETIAAIDRIFAGIKFKRICVEFESFLLPPWKKILEGIQESSAVFLLLSPHLKESPYTQNWVSFEVGMACALNKEVWVFEKFGKPVNFPVPYLNHYILYDPTRREHLDYIKSKVEQYGPSASLIAAGLGALLGAAISGGSGAVVGGIIGLLSQGKIKAKSITCQHSNCGIKFELHSAVNNFKCPSCRQDIIFTSLKR